MLTMDHHFITHGFYNGLKQLLAMTERYTSMACCQRWLLLQAPGREPWPTAMVNHQPVGDQYSWFTMMSIYHPQQSQQYVITFQVSHELSNQRFSGLLIQVWNCAPPLSTSLIPKLFWLNSVKTPTGQIAFWGPFTARTTVSFEHCSTSSSIYHPNSFTTCDNMVHYHIRNSINIHNNYIYIYII